MPKKNTPRSKKNSQRKRLSLVWIIGALIVAILLVAFVILAVINQNKTKQAKIEQDERARFAKAEAYVKDVTAEVIALVGQPQKQLAENTCHYSSAKFEKGTLSCETGHKLLYEPMGAAEADAIARQLSDRYKAPVWVSVGEEFGGFVSTEQSRASQSVFINLQGGKEVGCSIGLVYSSSHPENTPLYTKSENNLLLDLGCSDFAKAEIYTVKE